MIEVLEFRLRDGADEAAFLACDKRLQAEFAYQQPGLLRRTTARGAGGGWIVIDLWASAEDADRGDGRWGSDPLAQEFMGYLDRSTVRTSRWLELE